MDALVRLHAAAQPLLARVDATLASRGAPADHPVVPLLRRRGLLPGDAVANIVAWVPEPLCERAGLMRAHRERCALVDGMLGPPSTWEGAAAATFGARLGAARDEHDVLAANAATLAAYLGELADWITQGRGRLAHALATAMTSAQCVTLTAASAGGELAGVPPDGVAGFGLSTAAALAAADLAAEVLAEADTFWRGALDISDAWSVRLDAIIPASAPDVPRSTPTLRADL